MAESRIARGDLVEEIERIKAQPGGSVIAYGGAGFARALIRGAWSTSTGSTSSPPPLARECRSSQSCLSRSISSSSRRGPSAAATPARLRAAHPLAHSSRPPGSTRGPTKPMTAVVHALHEKRRLYNG